MRKINIPTKEDLEKINKLRLEGRSVNSLAGEWGYNLQTVLNYLRKYGYVKGRLRNPRTPKDDVELSKVYGRELRDNFMNGLLKVRKEYAEGQKVDVSYVKKGSYPSGAIRGRATVKKMYRDFMLLEKQGALGVVKECINFTTILAGDIKVAVVGG